MTKSLATLALIALACGSLPARASGQRRAVTEADVLAAVRTRDPEVLASRAAVAISRASEGEGAAYPNPRFNWQREHLPGDGALAQREDLLIVTVPVELGGARSARRALGEAATAEASAEHAQIAVNAAHDALATFYGAIALRDHIAIARAQLDRLAEAERVLSRRAAEGSVPGSDLIRVQLEIELARSALSDREAEAAAALAEVAALLDVPSDSIELSGDLALRAQDPPTGSRRIAALLEEGRAASARAQDSAQLAWIPQLELNAGAKLAAAGGQHAAGYIAGLTVELPFFNPNAVLAGQAAARSAALEAQRDATARARARREHSARARLEHARAEQARFEAATGEQVAALERAAASAYREGRQTVLELLDAQRVRATIDQRRIELRLLAKRAELDLRAASEQLAGGPP